MPRQAPAQVELSDHDNLVVMGRVLGPFGVKGWLKIRPFTQAIGALLDYPQWWLQVKDNARDGPDPWRVVVPVEGQEHGVTLLVRLDGMTGRDEAVRLTGARIAVGRATLPEPAAGEYYWADLIGMSVVNLQGVVLGAVTELIGTGAHDVLRVQGEREHLIPFVEVFVQGVDKQAKSISVDWQPDY
jgi:16S rRNA processing protein RimM